MNRRHLLSYFPGAAVMALSSSLAVAEKPPTGTPPLLPLFNPRQFGAVGDGKIMDTLAINNALAACNRAGGGIVYLSPGTYLSGTINIKSNVTLYIEAGATLLGSTNIKDYSPRRLVYAKDSENIGLAGPGRIDGQGHAFWIPGSRPPVSEENRWLDVTSGHLDAAGRPSPMIEFVNCNNIRIEDLRIEGAAGWTLKPFNCNRVLIHGIAIKNPIVGPNTDGIDIVGCQDVLVSDCVVETADDAIVLKSFDSDGVACRLSKNIVVTNCILSSDSNGFKIGTETHGGFENITFSNSVIYSDDVDLASRVIAGIAIEMNDGGWIDGVVITGIQMRRVRTPIFVRREDRTKARPNTASGLRGIVIDGVHATDAIVTSSITGIPGMEIENVTLSNIQVETTMPGKPEWVKSPVPEAPTSYPNLSMFGWLPASGLYCRHVAGLKLKDISFRAPALEWRPALVCDSVRELTVSSFRSSPAKDGAPPLSLIDIDQAWITGVAVPTGSRALMTLTGAASKEILVSGCDARSAMTLVESVGEIGSGVLRAKFNVLKAGGT